MHTVESSITVDVPVNRVDQQWRQFAGFHSFMQGVRKVLRVDRNRLHWQADIGGRIKEWGADIVEESLDQRIAWRSTHGAKNNGTINFTALKDDRTEVNVFLEYEPEGLAENLGVALGVGLDRISGDLKRFKRFIEKRPASAGWHQQIRATPIR